MSRRRSTTNRDEYKPRPIAAVAAEIPYRVVQAPRTANTAGFQHHHARSQSSTSSTGGMHSPVFSSNYRPQRQRITSGGKATQSADDREESQRSNDDSSGNSGGNSGNSNSTNTKSSESGSANLSSTTANTDISTASATSLLSTITSPSPEHQRESTTYYPPIGSIVSYVPHTPSDPPPLQFDALVDHVAKTRGMPEPGLDFFYARRALWMLPPPIPPRPVSPSPSRVKLEALLNQPGAVESEEVWKAGLKNVWKGLVGGNQLRKRLPLSIVLKILQAGWLRDGTWPAGMVAPSWDAPSTSAAATGGGQTSMDPSSSTVNATIQSSTILPQIHPDYPYYPYPSRMGAAYSGSPSSGDQLAAAEQASLQQRYEMAYGYGAGQAYPSSRPGTEPPTSGTPEPTDGQHQLQQQHQYPGGYLPAPQAYDDGFGDDDPEGDVDDDVDDEEEIDEARADDGRHEGG